MVNGIKKPISIPIAHHFVCSLNAKQKADLIKTVIIFVIDFMLNLRGFEYHKSREILEMANEQNPKKVNTSIDSDMKRYHDDLLPTIC